MDLARPAAQRRVLRIEPEDLAFELARIELEKRMELQERGSADAKEWASLQALFARLIDLEDLAGKINTALSRSGTAAQLGTPEVDEGQEVPTEEQAFPAVSNLKGFITCFHWTVRPEYVSLPPPAKLDSHVHAKQILDNLEPSPH